MQKKRRTAIQKGNVVLFPGTLERLHESGRQAMQKELYDEAIGYFEAIHDIDPQDSSVFDMLAVAFYETKEFERAKEFALLAIQNQTRDYIELLELYLTISIQLQEYEEVELTIQGLLEKNIIPEHSLQKFKYLRELNGRLSDRYVEDEAYQEPRITIENFMQMSADEQQDFLLSLQNQKLKPFAPLLREVIGQENNLPIVKTYALLLLQQSGEEDPIFIKKHHFETVIRPARLTPPENDQLTNEVIFIAKSYFEKDPTAGELVVNLIMKYSILMFPFHWGSYTAEETADAYIDYVKLLLYGKEPHETALFTFIRSVDEEMER